MSGHHPPTEPIPLPLAARLAGIPARTLRNWIASGKLAAIRGQRGWLVRTADIAQIAAMLNNDAANRNMADGMAAGLAAGMAAPPHDEHEPAANAADAANAAAIRVLDQRIEAEALIQRIIAPFVAEQTRLAEELGQVKAEREELRRRAEAAEQERDELRHQAAPEPPQKAPPVLAHADTPDAHRRAGGLWARIRRVLTGE